MNRRATAAGSGERPADPEKGCPAAKRPAIRRPAAAMSPWLRRPFSPTKISRANHRWIFLYLPVFRIRRIRTVFGPPGSGSFHEQAKKLMKTLISAVYLLLIDFLSLKTDVNQYLQKVISKTNWKKLPPDPFSSVTSKMPTKNVTDSELWYLLLFL
jgi:hypothetical protein